MTRRSEVVLVWRERFEAALAAAEVPLRGDLTGEPVNDQVRIQHTVEPCAVSAFSGGNDRIDEEGRFTESPVLGAREVALVALGRMRSEGRVRTEPDPGALIDEVLAEPEVLRSSLAGWVRNADRAALGCLASRSRGWFIDARAIASRHGDPDWQTPVAIRHDAPGRGVRLTAPVDAIRTVGSSRHLLVVLPRARDRDDRVARRLALLWALQRGEVVASVVCGHRSTLTRARFEVDDAFLGAACEEAAQEVGLAQRPSLAQVTPADPCRYCDLLDDCPEGTAHVVNSVGLPFPTPRCR